MEEKISNQRRLIEDLERRYSEKSGELELWIEKYRKQEELHKLDIQNMLIQYDQRKKTNIVRHFIEKTVFFFVLVT
jgi:hypothetical protein